MECDSLLTEEPIFQQANSCPYCQCFLCQPLLLLFLLCLLFFMDRSREHSDFAETRATVHHQMTGPSTSWKMKPGPAEYKIFVEEHSGENYHTSSSWKASRCVYTEMWCSPTTALGTRVHLKIKSNTEYFYCNQWLWEFSLFETIFFSGGHLACVASTKWAGEKNCSQGLRVLLWAWPNEPLAMENTLSLWWLLKVYGITCAWSCSPCGAGCME